MTVTLVDPAKAGQVCNRDRVDQTVLRVAEKGSGEAGQLGDLAGQSRVRSCRRESAGTKLNVSSEHSRDHAQILNTAIRE